MNTKLLSAVAILFLAAMMLTPQTGQSQSADATALATVEVAPELGSIPANCGQLAEKLVPDPAVGPAIGAWPIWAAVNGGGQEGKAALGMDDLHYIKDEHLPGWWGTKVGWVIRDSYKGEVKVQGYNLADHSPMYFQFRGDPVTTAVLNPARPGGSAAGLQHWSLFPSYVWVSKAGCYRLQAEWDGGSWQQTIAVGAEVGGPAGQPSVILSGPVEDAPAGCKPRVVAQRLTELFAALDAGQSDIVPQYFGSVQHDMFQWYSMTRIGPGAEKDNYVTHDLKELATYFVKRHQQHEHMRLVRLQVNSWQGDLVHFGPLTVMRSADDLHFGSKATEYGVDGKGTMNCKQGTFLVLSLVMNVS